MARNKKREVEVTGPAVDTVEHLAFERAVIPTAGEAQNDTEQLPTKTYAYDPHLDPQLEWAGKAERNATTVPTYALHQHEAVNPLRILKSALRDAEAEKVPEQLELFGLSERTKRRLREDEVFAYDHTMRWTNRMIAGDSLLVMNSLLGRENLAGKVQCVYMDPPYGIRFGSNFMPNFNKRDVQDSKDADLSTEPEMIRAFRDTWELGIHSYLSYLRDRFRLIRELLTESGSCFVQISMENVHRVRLVMDEVFGAENCVSMITYATTSGNDSATLNRAGDYILWYAKDRAKVKYHELYKEKVFGGEGGEKYRSVELKDGQRIPISEWEKQNGRKFKLEDISTLGLRPYRLDNLTSHRPAGAGDVCNFEFKGKYYSPGSGTFKTSLTGLNRLAAAKRIEASSNSLNYVRYFDDFPLMGYNNDWNDVGGIQSRVDGKIYVVQTSRVVVQRCVLMTTDPGDLVLDPTCGSGTTAVVAEQWGRRWITIDTSRIALALAKRRLITQAFDWYTLRDPAKGVDGGMVYKTVPHVKLGDIANGLEPTVETLWDAPLIEKGKVRVTGPFTVEALPSPTVEALEGDTEAGLAESGTKRAQWLAQLRAAGIRSRTGERMRFRTLEVTDEYTYFCARGTLEPQREGEEAKRVLVCMGSESAPMSSDIVNHALDEADDLHPLPQVIVFAAFQFDAESAKDIAEIRCSYATLLQVQMNVDLQMGDLLRKQRGDESFLLVGQPDVSLDPTGSGKPQCYRATVKGFDYYDPVKGAVVSGDPSQIAMWMLDSNYNGLCINPQQVFFPKTDAWEKHGRALRGTIDPAKFEAYVGVRSLPFTLGNHRQVAVKVIDVRGYESLRVFKMKPEGLM